MNGATDLISSDIAANLAGVRRRIETAAERVGRDPADIVVLPISKTVPAARLRDAIAAGLHRFGENRIQEAGLKAAELADLAPRWTVVGHLQTNKVKTMLAFADAFQALDSLRLAEALDRALEVRGQALDVHVQVNTSGEPSKFGLEPEAVARFLEDLSAFPTLRVRGLMTLAAFTSEEAAVRACFRRLKASAVEAEQALGHGFDLSMGMSGDFEIAIEEGATTVRVGQALFGARATPDTLYWPGAT